MVHAVPPPADLLPVPGAGSLRWAPEALPFVLARRNNPLPRVVATGDSDAVLVHLERSDRGETLVSRRLDGAFDRWPPAPGPKVEHVVRDFGNTPARITALRDGQFVMTSHDGLLGRWDAPAAIHPGARHAFPAADGTLWSMTERDGARFVGHRTGPAHEAVELVGRASSGPGYTLGAVSDDGALWLALVEHRPLSHRAPMPARDVDIVRVGPPGDARPGIVSVGTLRCSEGSSPEHLIASEQGAWFVIEDRDGPVVHRIGRDGVGGVPWRMPFAEAFPGLGVAARWRAGFAIGVLCQGRFVLLVSDGVHTTRVVGPAPGSYGMGRFPSVASSPDGRVLLVAHQTEQGFQLLRADVSSAPAADDPWAADRARAAEMNARRAAQRANPAPPPLPGQPVEAPGATVRHDKERFVAAARLRTLLNLVFAVEASFPDAVAFHGDAREGSHVAHDGCGNHLVLAWNEAGLVALGFDHEMHGGAQLPEQAERHLEDAPAVLAPLVSKAARLAGGMAGGGLWTTTGDAPRWQMAGTDLEMLAGYALTGEEALFGRSLRQSWGELFSSSEDKARLALRLAEASAAGPVTLGPEDERLLVAPSLNQVPRPPDPSRADQVAVALARLGITWTSAGEAVARASAARQEVALAALGAPQVALLRAARAGDLDSVRAALGAGADPNATACEGVFDDRVGSVGARHGELTALVLAARNGDLAMTEALLAAGADATAGRAKKVPPALRAALGRGEPAVIRRLLSAVPDFGGDDALHAYLGAQRPGGDDLGVIRALLERSEGRMNGAVRGRIAAAAEAAGDLELAAKMRSR